MQVVFIDDQIEICEIFELILSSELDANVKCFQDSISANEYLQAHQDEVSVIICDYRLPKENGLQFYSKVKDKKIPFIMLTGMIFNEDDGCFKDFSQNPQNRVFYKPINEDQLIEEIRHLV